MELTKIETEIVENTAALASEEQVRNLSELQLAFVGGGMSELVAL